MKEIIITTKTTTGRVGAARPSSYHRVCDMHVNVQISLIRPSIQLNIFLEKKNIIFEMKDKI